MFLLLYYGIFVVIFQSSSGHFLKPQAATFDQGKESSSVRPLIQTTSAPKSKMKPKCDHETNLTSGSIFHNDPCVTLFTNKCLETVFKTDILKEAFDFSRTTVKQYVDFLREYTRRVLCEIGVEKDNAAAIGEFTTRAYHSKLPRLDSTNSRFSWIEPVTNLHPERKTSEEYNTQYNVVPQSSPISVSMFSTMPSVTRFVKTCFDAVYSDDLLREVLDFSQTSPQQYSDFIRQYVKNSLSGIGVANAPEIGEFVSRSIKPNFIILTLPIVTRVYCNSVADFLFINGNLESHNVEDLALLYAQTIANSTKVTMNANPTSKFFAVADGFVNFFASLGLFIKRNGALIGIYFGNEWFLAALNYS